MPKQPEHHTAYNNGCGSTCETGCEQPLVVCRFFEEASFKADRIEILGNGHKAWPLWPCRKSVVVLPLKRHSTSLGHKLSCHSHCATALALYVVVLANQVTTCQINLTSAQIFIRPDNASGQARLSTNLDLRHFAHCPTLLSLPNPFLQHNISIRLTMNDQTQKQTVPLWTS
jgi:hypothetical protein